MQDSNDHGIAEFVASGSLVGAVTAVVERTGGATLMAHGRRGIADATPMPSDAIMRLHSMSKSITAVALLALRDAGACSLETEVATYLPELRELRPEEEVSGGSEPIRLRHLLTHTSGLPYPDPRGDAAARSLANAIGCSPGDDGTTLAEFTARVGRATLAHAPGDGFTYGISTDVLGRVIEVITGARLDEAIRSLVTAPLGMVDTSFEPPIDALARVAPIHRRDGHGTFVELRAPIGPVSLFSGGGGLFGTCGDFARFCAMLLGDGELEGVRVLARDTVRAFTRCQLGSLADRDDVRTSPHLGPGLGLSHLGRVVRDERGSDLGAPGAFGWDGVCGNTYVVDRASGIAGVLLTQILPWPAGLHRAFRRAVRTAATISSSTVAAPRSTGAS